jgi:hypothetical protein
LKIFWIAEDSEAPIAAMRMIAKSWRIPTINTLGFVAWRFDQSSSDWPQNLLASCLCIFPRLDSLLPKCEANMEEIVMHRGVEQIQRGNLMRSGVLGRDDGGWGERSGGWCLVAIIAEFSLHPSASLGEVSKIENTTWHEVRKLALTQERGIHPKVSLAGFGRILAGSGKPWEEIMKFPLESGQFKDFGPLNIQPKGRKKVGCVDLAGS